MYSHKKKKAGHSNPGADIYMWDMLKDNMYSNSPHTANTVKEVIHNYVLCYDNTIFIKACVLLWWYDFLLKHMLLCNSCDSIIFN